MNNIYLNSKNISKNDVFIALKGKNENGNKYIKDALNNGASLILSETKGKYFKKNLKKNLNKILIEHYKVKNKVKLIGITGTNGKSTYAYNLHKNLIINGYKSKLITSIKGIEESFYSSLTTPRNDDLIRFIKESEDENVEFLIMEVSSIGYIENRVNDLSFELVIITNLEKDHLDYHRNVFSYHNAKLEFAAFQKRFIFGKAPLKAVFNTLKLKMFEEKEFIPIGRDEEISVEPKIVIDYAHTESAYEYILSKYKHKNGLLYVIFGLGGERDKSKRIIIGNIVKKYSDIAIITNDNPRNENEFDIIFDTIKGHFEYFYIIPNRENAIKYCIERLESNDYLLILGKGHEDYQIINGKINHFSDKEIVMKYLSLKSHII